VQTVSNDRWFEIVLQIVGEEKYRCCGTRIAGMEVKEELLFFETNFLGLRDAVDNRHRRTFHLHCQQSRRGSNEGHRDLVRPRFDKSRILQV
jgi:hypothetical protein